jgi:CNT family concentrative nucleoside transporter
VADSIHALTGMAGLLAIAWAMSEKRRAIPWRAVLVGVGLTTGLALLFLKVELLKRAFLMLNDVLLVLERATQAGTSLVFGYLGGGPAPFAVSNESAVFILAFRALPLVLVISALSALLFYWRVLPAIVRALSYLLEKTMKVGGVVGLSTAANVFVGMVEAPLFVRPYLARISRGELFAIMAGGMASIAGTVLFLYGSILSRVQPDAVAHLLIASILSAPAALAIAFALSNPDVATVLFGATTPEQVRENAAAGDVRLPSDVVAAVDAALERVAAS